MSLSYIFIYRFKIYVRNKIFMILKKIIRFIISNLTFIFNFILRKIKKLFMKLKYIKETFLP